MINYKADGKHSDVAGGGEPVSQDGGDGGESVRLYSMIIKFYNMKNQDQKINIPLLLSRTPGHFHTILVTAC